MLVKQLSVFVENTPGKMEEITGVLSRGGIDIRALSIADTTDFGILRLIVNRPMEAYAALKEAGCTVSLTDVLAVEVDDRPGGLARVMALLTQNDVSIEYIYAFVGRSGHNAYVILKASDQQAAADALLQNGVRLICSSELYEI